MKQKCPAKRLVGWVVPDRLYPPLSDDLFPGRLFRTRQQAREYAAEFFQKVIRVEIREVDSEQ